MLPNYQARSLFVLKHTTSLLASERSERDTYRGNTIENRGYQFIYYRASEASDILLGVDNAKSGICYIYIYMYVWMDGTYAL